MDRRVTPPRRATSPTFGPPPPCKQALKKIFFLVSYRTKFKILQGNCKTTNGECINYKTVDYMSRMALEKDDFRSFLPGNLGISCYKKLGRGARCINGENGPLTAKKCPH